MSGSPQEDQQQAVLCDMCTEDRKRARKTCMKCEISMCVQHLQAHLTTPVLLQTHPLTEPMAAGAAGLSGTKCPQHGKLLEYYCLDDLTCVCVSCAIEDQHRLHNMKTFSTAHKDLIEKLKVEQQALAKTDDENVSLEKWEKNERAKLGSSSVRLIEAVNNLRDIALTSVQSSVSARMVSIKTSKSSIQAAQKEKDTFRFLQMFSQVHQDVEKAKAVDLRKGLEPGEDRDKLVQELRQDGEKMVGQAVQLWGSLLTLVDPENHQEIITTSSDLTFDPQTLGIGMLLSEDHRKIFYSSWLGQMSLHTLQIRSVNPASNFQRWMVSLPSDYDWTIGLCDKESAKNLKDGHIYGLCCQGNQLSSLMTDYENPDTEIPETEKELMVFSELIPFVGENGAEVMPRPQKVEVFWNCAASSLSFFSRIGRHQKVEILKIKMSLNSQDLSPFVKFEKRMAQNVVFGQQKQWKCSCGKIYTDQVNHYTDGRRNYSKYPQTLCSCGGVIGGPCITKLLCELL